MNLTDAAGLYLWSWRSGPDYLASGSAVFAGRTLGRTRWIDDRGDPQRPPAVRSRQMLYSDHAKPPSRRCRVTGQQVRYHYPSCPTADIATTMSSMQIAPALLYQILKDALPLFRSGTTKVKLTAIPSDQKIYLELRVLNTSTSKPITVKRITAQRTRDSHTCVPYWEDTHRITLSPAIQFGGIEIRPGESLGWHTVVPTPWIMKTIREDEVADTGSEPEERDKNTSMTFRVVVITDSGEFKSQIVDLPPSKINALFKRFLESDQPNRAWVE